MSADWFDAHAWGVRYREQLDVRVKAKLKAEAAAREAETREREQRLVEAGDPAAMRRLLERLAAEHRISITWTADRNQWWARVQSRTVSIPPPIDRVALSTGLHELAHVINGPCRGAAHRAHSEQGKHRCLECERLAWKTAADLVPFDKKMFEKSRHCLGTYRRAITAPRATQAQTDRQMGVVTWGREHLRRAKWQMRVDAIDRWKQELDRERYK